MRARFASLLLAKGAFLVPLVGAVFFVNGPHSIVSAQNNPVCGDGVCTGEEAQYCDSDCYGSDCGDGICAPNEYGWCSGEPGCQAQTCTDSDPIDDPLVRGYVEADGQNRRYDYCLGERLWQFNCYRMSDGTLTYGNPNIVCSSGCSNGACIATASSSSSAQSNTAVSLNRLWAEEQSSCDDLTYGGADCATFVIWADIRVNGSKPVSRGNLTITLHEWIPEQGQYMFPLTLNFDQSTRNFSIKDTFTNDLLPAMIKYRVTMDNAGSSTTEERTLLFPSSQLSRSSSSIRSSNTTADRVVLCTDTDTDPGVSYNPNDQYTKGEIHQVYADGGDQYDADECKDSKNLYEFSCKNGVGMSSEVICFYSCSNGACTKAPYGQTSSEPRAGFEDEVNGTNAFRDVDLQTAEGQAANALYNQGVIGGFPDGEFKGSRFVNRAEASKFLLNGIGEQTNGALNQGRFSDVREGEWYVPFVIRAADLGIIKGDGGKSTFRPADGVNTAEFLAMLARAFHLPLGTPHQYPDVASGDWFNPYAGIAWNYGFFQDRGGKLDPGRTLTRNEVAVSLNAVMTDPYKLSRLPQESFSQAVSSLPLSSGTLPAPRTTALADIPDYLQGQNPGLWMDRLVYSERGNRLAYVAQLQGKEAAIVDGVQGKLYDAVGSLTFSADGTHLAYVAGVEGDQRVIVDGVEGKQYDRVSELLFSPNGTLAYRAEKGDEEYAVLGTTEGKHYTNAWIHTKAFLPSGELVYEVDTPVNDYKNMRKFLVIGGQEQVEQYGDMGRVFYSDDGKHMAFEARKSYAGEQMIVLDGQEKPEYSSIRFGPQGAVAYVAILPGGNGLLFRGTTSPAYTFIESVGFSADGNHVAFIAQKSDASRVLTVDGKILAQAGAFGEYPLFTPNGAIVYRSRDTQGLSVFIDEQRGPVFEYVWDPVLSSDGKAVIYGAFDGQKFLRVEQLLGT